MTTRRQKRPQDKRRKLAPLDDVDAKDGPAMKALPNDRWRAFVRALYQVKPGHGAQVRAAKLAGFGTETSTPETMAVLASRLAHDERVQAALAEEDRKHIRASAPRAIRALSSLIENPNSRDHARGIAMVLDRVHPAETHHSVHVEHNASRELVATAAVLARIDDLWRAVGLGAEKMPPLIDVNPESKSGTAA